MVSEQHYSADKYAVDLYVTEGADGLLVEATLTDPATDDSVDVWTDGDTVWWSGTVDGEPTTGTVPLPVSPDDPKPEPEPLCFTPVSAIICVGVVVLAAASCAHTTWCIRDPDTEVPGEPGGVPPGGDGDGDGDGDETGSSGGGDDD